MLESRRESCRGEGTEAKAGTAADQDSGRGPLPPGTLTAMAIVNLLLPAGGRPEYRVI